MTRVLGTERRWKAANAINGPTSLGPPLRGQCTTRETTHFGFGGSPSRGVIFSSYLRAWQQATATMPISSGTRNRLRLLAPGQPAEFCASTRCVSKKSDWDIRGFSQTIRGGSGTTDLTFAAFYHAARDRNIQEAASVPRGTLA